MLHLFRFPITTNHFSVLNQDSLSVRRKNLSSYFLRWQNVRNKFRENRRAVAKVGDDKFFLKKCEQANQLKNQIFFLKQNTYKDAALFSVTTFIRLLRDYVAAYSCQGSETRRLLKHTYFYINGQNVVYISSLHENSRQKIIQIRRPI